MRCSRQYGMTACLHVPLYHRIDILYCRERHDPLRPVNEVHIYLTEAPAADESILVPTVPWLLLPPQPVRRPVALMKVVNVHPAGLETLEGTLQVAAYRSIDRALLPRPPNGPETIWCPITTWSRTSRSALPTRRSLWPTPAEAGAVDLSRIKEGTAMARRRPGWPRCCTSSGGIWPYPWEKAIHPMPTSDTVTFPSCPVFICIPSGKPCIRDHPALPPFYLLSRIPICSSIRSRRPSSSFVRAISPAPAFSRIRSSFSGTGNGYDGDFLTHHIGKGNLGIGGILFHRQRVNRIQKRLVLGVTLWGELRHMAAEILLFKC